MESGDRLLALLQQVLLELAALAVVIQHTLDLLGCLPLAVPVLLAIFYAISPSTVGILLTRANNLQIRSDGLVATDLVLLTLTLGALNQLDTAVVDLLRDLIHHVRLCVHSFLQSSAILDLGLSRSLELSAQMPGHFVLFVLLRKVALERGDQLLCVGIALCTSALTVVAPDVTLGQLYDFTIAVAAIWAHLILGAAPRVVLPDQQITVVQALGVFLLGGIHLSGRDHNLAPAPLHSQLLLLQGSIQKFGVLCVTVDDLAEDCEHQHLIGSVRFLDRRLNDRSDHC
mmetsp:Transcript_1686/g.3516  ORF Transcript_1686/g.3516 Transcript_1686/m.3516 type:complete len:286 (-) Transcript_1686:272-1129(-)